MGNPSNQMIPVCVPRLPAADALVPYLEEIDRNRRYSNGGPLVRRLEQRLAKQWGLDPSSVVLVSSGTSGLSLALAASGASAASLCLLPAWTFAATAQAARAAGLTPYFADVDPASWALEPDTAKRALETAPAPVGAVVPVSPFGAAIDIDGWRAFAAETNIPVVFDAAAAFDSLVPDRFPSVISLHATKVFGIGEGGVVVARDRDPIARVRQTANLGFDDDRHAAISGVNAKLSEYAAAVGLAALDAWPLTQPALSALARTYSSALARLPGLVAAPGFGRGWAPSTCVVSLTRTPAAAVASDLREAGIETCAWWGAGCHRQAAFADCPRTDLPVTEHLAAHTLGLPFHLGVDQRVLRQVVSALEAALHRHAHLGPQRAIA